MRTIVLLSILTLGFLTACSESGESDVLGSGKNRIARMDISDAVALFINNGGTRASSDSNSLFKITKDGIIKQVTYLNEVGNEVTQDYTPQYIYVIDNSPYFFVRFNDWTTYMVNKSTGAVYESPISNFMSTKEKMNQSGKESFVNEKTIKTDKQGNIYYYNGSTIHKIDISNANNTTDEVLTPASDRVQMYVVSGNGELLYRFYRDSGYNYRLRTTSGRLIPFSPEDDGQLTKENMAFQGFDGNIHVFDRRALYTIQFKADGTYETEDIIYDDCIEKHHAHGPAFCENGSCLSNTVYYLTNGWSGPYLVKLHDRYLAISYDGEAMVIDSKNDPSLIKMETHNVTGGMMISQLEYNDSYVYCCGQKNGNYSLLRINPYTYESEAVVRDNDYEIYSFTVLNDNTIIFNGLRLSDGKTIIASIDNKGGVKVLEEINNYTKITLNRLQ